MTWAVARTWVSIIRRGRSTISTTRFAWSFWTVRLSIVQDVDLDLPTNFGLGVANRSLLDGRLLLAADVLYKQWDEAALFKALYDNQWVLQLGAQYAMSPRMRLRMGYVYAENPIDPTPGGLRGRGRSSGGALTVCSTSRARWP